MRNFEDGSVVKLVDLDANVGRQAGGKARVLSRLAQAGYHVPDGFVILPKAFDRDGLRAEAWAAVYAAALSLQGGEERALAVRSSAWDEDSALASFAGEFESVLNVRSEEELRAAVDVVFRSQFSERVSAYRSAQTATSNPTSESRIAILVQRQIDPDYAGVLFTADPVSGSRVHMTGSYVAGLGEALVSGAADGAGFTLERPSGRYQGPAELQPFAARLFELGRDLETEFGGPQDIEWAVDSGGLHLLQARPVTTFKPYDPIRGDWNDSRRGDYLWSNSNFGEAFPDIMTPATWSQVQIYAEETFGNPLPGDHPLFGNIGGRLYFNLSLYKSIFAALGMSRERMNHESEEFFGTLPDDIEIPDVSFPRLGVLAGFIPFAVRAMIRRRRNLRDLERFITVAPQVTAEIKAAIAAAPTPQALADLYVADLEPTLRLAYQMLQAGTSQYENAYRPLQRMLLEKVGPEDANHILANVSMPGDELASLGPLLGLSRLKHGELSREDYLRRYGHRGPHEMELSIPRPAEDPAWLEAQLARLDDGELEVMLERREDLHDAAWKRFAAKYPNDAARLERKLIEAAQKARLREAIRSEETRLYGLMRTFILRAAELTGHGDELFFLWQPELMQLLQGDNAALAHTPVRRAAHERLSDLPSYPAMIRGLFDPERWAADPRRRSDYFGPARQDDEREDQGTAIRGYPASAGVAEGQVRVLSSSEEGDALEPGEVLVATTTNVGWTPLFPRAGAIVTDVGAPLSHAAIVARELGLPAVVGTGDATMRLVTGDRVRVDGAAGTVEKLQNPV